jgi:restriction system protein
MPIPDYASLMLPLLKALSDGTEHSAADVRDALAATIKLSESELSETLPSGKQSIFNSRVGWAKTYLAKAGLIVAPKRGVYKITGSGSALLTERITAIDNSVLSRFESFRTFIGRPASSESSVEQDTTTPPSVVAATPEEVLESSYRAVRARVESELLDAVRAASPEFFEKLVVELLVAMGYGGSIHDAERALAVGKSHDGGIDGIIKEDHLGLDAIYVQAKRWQANVGRPEVQAFAGSLEGERARKGVMLTTSAFSKEAMDYVKKIEKRIVLIDGLRLAELMFKFGVGVNDVSAYEIKRVDGDYFSEE